MTKSLWLWLLVAVAIWYLFLRSKPAAAGTVPMVNGQPSGAGTGVPGTSSTGSAASGLTSPQGSMPSLNQMAGWGGQTYTTQPNDASVSANAGTSFAGDDLMCLS